MAGMPPPDRVPIAERYRFEQLIGRGGMGTVWHATDLLIGRSVAIKDVLLPPHASDDDRQRAQARIRREANAAARISDPAVVTVYDVIDEDERLFLVMEYVPAPSLETVVGQRGPLPVEEVGALGRRLAGALAAAHGRGVIHRDVKPSNVLVPDDGGSAKLVDFGIAAIADTPGITATGFALGSPSFVSPERAEGKPATAASDVFSLGATLYFAIEGVGPFERDSSMATLAAITSKPPRAPKRASRLGPLLLEMMDKDPVRRPDLDAVRSRLGDASPAASLPKPEVAASEAGGGETRVVGSLQHRPPAPSPAPSASHRLRWLAVAAAGVLAATGVGVGAALSAGGGDSSGTTTTHAPASTGSAPATTVSQPSTTATGGQPSTTARPTTTTRPTTTAARGVPAGFVRYEDPQGAFTAAVPDAYALDVDADRHLTEFTLDHRAITVRWFEPGIDPIGYLGREQRRIAALPRYRRIALEQRAFGGHPGTFWAFEFAFNGAPDRLLRSTGRVFAVEGHTFGVFFRAPAEEFADLQAEVFSVVERTFRPTVGSP
jgi:eukaryotic-like serine/threonine-protein kinase